MPYVVITMEKEMSTIEIDWHEGQDLTGCTDQQTKFVQGLVEGKNKFQAYRDAGYGMDGAAGRGAASRLAKSHKVRALLAWAKGGGAGPTDNPGDLKELKRILWRHARGADKNHSIKAAQVLHQLAEREQLSVEGEQWDGLSDYRLARDLIIDRGDEGAAIMLLSRASWGIDGCPMFWDVIPRVQRTYPEILARLLARHSDMMKRAFTDTMADREFQKDVREQIWGERGYTLNPDGGVTINPDGPKVKAEAQASQCAEASEDSVA
jgi:hypothetical protein